MITTDKIKKDSTSFLRTFVLSIFTIVGFLLPLLPFISSPEIDDNSIITFFVFLIIFGIPFGLFFGLRNLITEFYDKNCISNGRFTIVEDIITDIYVTGRGSSNDTDNDYGQVTLKKYSDKTSRNVRVKCSELRRVKEGDKCILVFIKNRKRPFIVYPGKEYDVDLSLQSKIDRTY